MVHEYTRMMNRQALITVIRSELPLMQVVQQSSPVVNTITFNLDCCSRGNPADSSGTNIHVFLGRIGVGFSVRSETSAAFSRL